MPPAPRSVVAVAALAVTALLAACASSDDDGTTPDDGAGDTVVTTTTTESTENTENAEAGEAPEEIPCWVPVPEVSAPGDADPVVTIGEPIAEAWEPVAFIHHPSGQGYVLERHGFVRAVGADGTSPVLLDVSDAVEPNVEEGLLGGVFSPDGEFIYLYKVSEGRSLLVQFAVDTDGTPDPESRREILTFAQPFENHNGGEVLFGPDCMLYLFTGDGIFDFTGSDPLRTSLDLSSPHGKVLRLDPTPDGDAPYVVPTDNPFVDDDEALDLVWSYGLRNPWRASFDPATGDLWIGDVGESSWEEINVAWADDGYGRGVSYGWSAWEGPERRNDDQPADGHQDPWFAYERCSVTAGERYRGSAIPDLAGWFVFADFCFGTVWALEVTPERLPGRLELLGEVPRPVDVRAGPDGEIYVVSIDGGIHPLLPPESA